MVQGVGFRPFVFRLARANTLNGWVLNGEDGVEIHLEGSEGSLDAFVRSLEHDRPAAATITAIDIKGAESADLDDFTIRESHGDRKPTVRISPDLPVCGDCLAELFDPANRRYRYPYINCANCGPRYSVVLKLPYDRSNTTMKAWPLDDYCTAQYGDPGDRRFHAQPAACGNCGPQYFLRVGDEVIARGEESLLRAVELLKTGSIVAMKGIGGYHLSCDARNEAAVAAMRERKYRKEKPFALMAANIAAARGLVELSADEESLLCSSVRPIVLARAKVHLSEVAPGNAELGVMLPYTPLHALLFECGAPDVLVMTSANRSSEPIAYDDEEAVRSLTRIADAFLIGERPIARRVDDSIARVGTFGPVILRRARGYAPSAVAEIPISRPILAVGADLKSAVTLVVDGQAFVSQHIGDLDHYECLRAFRETIDDLASMYDIRWSDTIVAHDLHPQYHSTLHALDLPGCETIAVQHHQAHIASVLAERRAWQKRVLGVSFDGTGYGDDGTIWGGEIFAGSVEDGFERIAHLRQAALAGGDAAARFPVQAAAGFLAQLDDLPDLMGDPFCFPRRYENALALIRQGLRCFPTTSMGRLFDAAAALLGFTRETTFEGQAAIWLEHLAGEPESEECYPFPMVEGELDFRPLLEHLVHDRARGKNAGAVRASLSERNRTRSLRCGSRPRAGKRRGYCRALRRRVSEPIAGAGDQAGP